MRELGCRVCEGLTSGDCGGHGPRFVNVQAVQQHVCTDPAHATLARALADTLRERDLALEALWADRPLSFTDSFRRLTMTPDHPADYLARAIAAERRARLADPPIQRPRCRAGHPMTLEQTEPRPQDHFAYVYACALCRLRIRIDPVRSEIP